MSSMGINQEESISRGSRNRVEAVVETLATMRNRGESLSEVAHDARNMVTALGLYCDLLEEPGVLATPFIHYGSELRLVAAASRRLVEKLVGLDTDPAPGPAIHGTTETDEDAATQRMPNPGFGSFFPVGDMPAQSDERRYRDNLPAVLITNFAAELLANRNLLAALVGPSIALTVDTNGGAQPVRLNGEDLTRVLVNLTKNAAEAMPAGGGISMSLCDRPGGMGTTACVALAIEDNGPGLAEDALEEIFMPGYTTRGNDGPSNSGWPVSHRGLGLSITRSIIEAAGGRVLAGNRPNGGARVEIELPVRKPM